MKVAINISKEELKTKLGIKDGAPGRPGKDGVSIKGEPGTPADEARIVQEVLSKLPPPPFLEPLTVRDKLETLPEGEKLSIQAIQDLSKILEEMRQAASSKSSASLISKRIRFIDDETPSGAVNGVNKIFTLTSKFPEAGSLKVYVNGSRMRVTEDYTLSNRTITFITAPPTTSIVLCDYRY